MESLVLFTSASGRIARQPFWIGVAVVYVASFLTQFLLAAPIVGRASVAPFLLAQAVIAWAWYALHAKRLRDAGHAVGWAVALTVLYGLAMVLLCLVVILTSTTGGNAPLPPTGVQPPPPTIFDLFLLLFLLGMIFSEPSLGFFAYILLGVIAVILLPFLIAFIFTIWAGTRPSVPDVPVAP